MTLARHRKTPGVGLAPAGMFLLMSLFGLALAPAGPAWAEDPDQAAPETGLLEIKAPVDGAQVYIDNALVGPAPVSQYVSAGAHTVHVAADHYDPFVRKVQIRAGTRSALTATLMRGGSTVEFQANASGARVSVDGGPESPVPVRLKDVAAGHHTWKLTAQGHEPAEGSFDFLDGQNIFVVAELQSSRGMFIVESTPAGASVLLDGRDVGRTPLALEGIAPGEHVVDLSLEGHGRVLQLVDTSDGSKGEVRTELDEGGGKAVIKTGAADAEVRYNGVVIGTGSKVVFDALARGRYGIEVVKPGAKPATGRLKSEGHGRSTYRADWADEGDRGRSRLVELPPLYERWTFWTAVGVGAGGALTGGIVAYQASKPVPIPDGDVVVTLP